MKYVSTRGEAPVLPFGDTLLAGYSWDKIGQLAGRQDDYWRKEYIALVDTAGSLN